MDIQLSQISKMVMQFSAGMGITIKDQIAASLLNILKPVAMDQSAPSNPLNLIQQAFADQGINLDENTALHILKGITSSLSGGTNTSTEKVADFHDASLQGLVLKPGSEQKEEVGLLQDLLRQKGYEINDSNGLYRGIYGDQTKQAVIHFQKMQELVPDGIAGPLTLKALMDYQYEPTDLPEGLTKKNDAVDISHLHNKVRKTFPSIVEVWKAYSAPSPVITSGNDAVHSSANSKHYSDRALDLRGNNVSDETLKKMADELREKLGSGYFVQAEFFPNNPSNDHIHIQYNGS